MAEYVARLAWAGISIVSARSVQRERWSRAGRLPEVLSIAAAATPPVWPRVLIRVLLPPDPPRLPVQRLLTPEQLTTPPLVEQP